MIMKNFRLCPICSNSKITVLSTYPGDFLICDELNRCDNCDITFASPLPDQSTLEYYYKSGSYTTLNQSVNEEAFIAFSYKLSLSRYELIEKFAKSLPRPGLILDIGAGKAIMGKALKDRWGSCTYDVVEPDTEISESYGDWVDDIYTEIHEAPKRKYDLVVMNQVLEHVIDPVTFIEAASDLLNQNGFLYIDVPYHDYKFKPSVSPHLFFYSTKSLTKLLNGIGVEVIFCDTAGMKHNRAREYFSGKKISISKIVHPWTYLNLINRVLGIFGIPNLIDTFYQFESDNYGGDRQWLRCIAKKES